VRIHPTIVKSRQFGEFEILFQYVNEEPALVVRAHRFLVVRKRAWVITLESAWKYVDDVAHPGSGHSEYMVYASAKIAEMLGLGDDVMTRFRIAEGIQDCLEDLLNMKPMKVERPKADGEISGSLDMGGDKVDIHEEFDGSMINSTEGFTATEPHPSEMDRGDLDGQ
jgi:hypothetical protein